MAGHPEPERAEIRAPDLERIEHLSAERSFKLRRRD